MICTENSSGDFECLLSFLAKQKMNRLNSSPFTQVSKIGHTNLAKEFDWEDMLLDKLSYLAQKAVVSISMRYNPVFGAMPNLLPRWNLFEL
jgi:hypothetical protein